MRAKPQDLSWSFLAGICRGLFGIDGPPLVWHFGRAYEKAALRKVLIAVFMLGAFVRAASYCSSGLMSMQLLGYVALCLPGQVLGLYLGNKLFFAVPERQFSIVIGFVLSVISIRLLWLTIRISNQPIYTVPVTADFERKFYDTK